MSEQQKQIPKLVASLVEHQGAFGSMSTDDRQWVIQNTKDAIGLFAEAVKNRITKEVKKILTLVAIVKVAAVEHFVAAEKFREGKTTDGVKIAWLGDNFKTNFLGKTEEGIKEAELKIHKLDQNLLDAPIMNELGDTAETTLAHLWELLKRQPKGEEGELLVNGWANIAYIRDGSGELWAVNSRWRAGSGGWHVEALSVTHPLRWYAGSQVVSR